VRVRTLRIADERGVDRDTLSRERRQRVNHRLRAGDLRALVATAPLRLGAGAVET
jgi:Lhr-like helicase